MAFPILAVVMLLAAPSALGVPVDAPSYAGASMSTKWTKQSLPGVLELTQFLVSVMVHGVRDSSF